MTIDPAAVGVAGDPRSISWDSKDALLYAVGIGAGRQQLAFTTENTIDVQQQVYPTFALMAGADSARLEHSALARAGTFEWENLVHGSQAITLHRSIPVEGSAETQESVVAIYDKGSAAVVVVETTAVLPAGEPLWTLRSAAFIRGEGGWGGSRGPSGPQNAPPSSAPDVVTTLTTSSDQAFVYRLSGDRNPLHTDPTFAARGGFEQPILHGLCTYGMTARALLEEVCGGSPGFRHMDGRFSAPVIPGESLTVHAWVEEPGRAIFTTSVDERVVIDQGLLVFD